MKSTRRGVALIFTLGVAFFLVVLLGAFLVVNRTNSALTSNGLKRQGAYNACLTGLHYLWGEIEGNQAFGAGGFAAGVKTYQFPPVDPKLKIVVHGDPDSPDDTELNYIEGQILDSGDSFKAIFANNLQNRGVVDHPTLGQIPGRSVKVQISGRSGGLVLSLQAVLRKRPFVDYAALSSRDMSVELSDQSTGSWKIRSKDPYVNQIRTNQQLSGPSAVDGGLVFKGPPRDGTAKATDDIILDGTSVRSDPDFLAQSERRSGGSLRVGTPNIDVPGLKKEDLRFPETRVSIPAGRLTFKALEKHEWSSKQFQIDTSIPPDGIPDTTVTRWRLQRSQYQAIEHQGKLWVSQTSVPLDDTGELLSANDGVPSPTSSPGFQGVGVQPTEFDDHPVLYGDEPDHRMRANLVTGEVALSSGTKFEAQGDLTIEREAGANQPNLLFGYSMDDQGETEFSAGLVGSAAVDDPESNSAALVSSGNLQIDGIATGFGSIFSDKNVLLRAKSGLRAAPDLAVAVHGEQINFAAEEPPDGVAAKVMLEADWSMFKEAMSKTGYPAFDNWFDNNLTTRRQLVGNNPDLETGLRSKSVGKPATFIWDELKKDLPLGATPNFSAPPFGSEWSGNLTLDKYVRLREYARTGNRSWLTLPGTQFSSVVAQIDSQVQTYSQWATLMGLPMADFMAASQPEVADVYFVGLVHAGTGGFICDTNGASLLVEGAVVSQGEIRVTEAPSVDFVYNRLYLDDVVREFRGDPIELDQVYFKIN